MSIAELRKDFDGNFPAETEALLIWNHLVEPGDRIFGILTKDLGSQLALEKLRVRNFEATDEVSSDELRAAFDRWFPRLERLNAKQVVEIAIRSDSKLLLPSDPHWPESFKSLGSHAPMLLWYRGSIACFQNLDRAIGVVGSRTVTRYGQSVTSDVTSSIVLERGSIISGGALGVDSVAHRSAIAQGGLTVAFMAGSLENLYPSANANLFEEIAHTGLLISEMAPGSKPTRWRFLQRNRLIAATSQAVVVTEAGLRSGSINTANHSIELDRPVFAFPGPVTSPNSAGCNRLIREQKALALLDPRDIPEELGWVGATANHDSFFGSLELRLLDFLSKTERSTADLAADAGLTQTELNLALATLQLNKQVAKGPKGGWFRTF